MRAVFVLAIALLAAALGVPRPSAAAEKANKPKAGEAAKAADTSKAGDSSKVATIGTHAITRAELEEYIRPKLLEIENERYDALSEGLDEMIATEVMRLEARERNTNVDALGKDEIDSKVKEPSDAEVQKLYDENKDELKGQTFDKVKPQLVEYLKQQGREARRAQYVEELKKKYKTTVSLRPPVVQVETAGRPERGGGAKAPVTIIEFSDYQCPFCKRAEDVVNQVMKTYGDKVRLVYRDYPLPMHSQARPAAEAAACANAQGKYWDYHAKLFANQSALGEDKLKQYAKDVGLDGAKFDQCLAEKPGKAAIDKDVEDGGKVGVNGTPAFFINGRMLTGAQPFEKFKQVIDEELSAKTASAS